MIRKQEEDLETMFELYHKDMERDLDNFMDFMTFYHKKKQNGELVDIDPIQLEKWKGKI